MNSELESESAREPRRLSFEDGYCDINSMSFRRHGPYNFDLEFRGQFIPPAFHMRSSHLVQQAGQGNGVSATFELTENLPSGGNGRLRSIPSDKIGKNAHELDGLGAATGQINDNEFIKTASDTLLDASGGFNFHFPSQAGNYSFPSIPEFQDRPYHPAFEAFHINNFSRETQNDNFRNDIPHQRIDHYGRCERNERDQWTGSTRAEVNVSSGGLDENASKEAFGMASLGLEIDVSSDVDKTSNDPLAGLKTSFSSSDYNLDQVDELFWVDDTGELLGFAGNIEPIPNALQASDGRIISTYEFDTNSLNDAFAWEGHDIPSSQESGLSTDFNITPISSAPSSRSQAATPSSSNSSPDRHSCRHCLRTFKRQSDTIRHEKLHLPGQRKFNCWHLGCTRNGQRAFYSRDKLRNHEKQVHGL